MSDYSAKFLPLFCRHVKTLKKKPEIETRLDKKIAEILKNPCHYKPLRNVLKNHRRTHIGSYVLIFEVQEAEKTVVFHSFQLHDEAYKKTH